MNDYKFKVGDKVNFIGNAKEHYVFGEDLQTDIDKYNNVFTIGRYVSKDYIEFEENSCWCIKENEIKLYTSFNGIMLLKEIKNGSIKNCDIEVYKNNIDILICNGENAKNIIKSAEKCGMNKENIYYFEDKKQVQEFVESKWEKGDVILFKASNGMKFFDIVSNLEKA